MQKYFFIRTNGRYVKINFDEIIYVEGCRNYVKLVTDIKSHLVLFSMKGVEKLLPAQLFRRIHKSFIVSLDKMTGFDGEKVYLKDKELPIGHQYKGELEKAVMIASDSVSESLISDSFYTVPMIVNGNQRRDYFEAG